MWKRFQNLRSDSRARRQADRESAAYMGMRAFTGGLQRSHWALDGVLNPLLVESDAAAGCGQGVVNG